MEVDRRTLDFVVGLDTELNELVEGSHLYTPQVRTGLLGRRRGRCFPSRISAGGSQKFEQDELVRLPFYCPRRKMDHPCSLLLKGVFPFDLNLVDLTSFRRLRLNMKIGTATQIVSIVKVQARPVCGQGLWTPGCGQDRQKGCVI